MNVTQLAAKRRSFLKVYSKEISARQDTMVNDLKFYKGRYEGNCKGMKPTCEKEHVWVPMTFLWIHDGARRGHLINGIKRRGFSEAMPFKVDDYQVLPQMCWYCNKTRERINKLVPWQERATLTEQIIKDGKRRKRRPRNTAVKAPNGMLTDLDKLLT